jgi:acyl-lipid omega-6 desaturase (Delta-12 desaturase)
MTTDSASTRTKPKSTTSSWKEVVAKYQQPKLRRALWQVTNTLVPYAALWYLMHLSLGVSYWLTGLLALLAGGFLVRVFIIFHDCGHGSFFKSREANDVLGFITGVVSFTPYYHWRWEHALHHASSGDLDNRGTGDIWTLTVQEYLEASRWKRCAYRLARNPGVLFLLAPLFLFLIKQRFALPKAARRERNSVHWTNLALLAMAAGLSCLFGLKAYLLLQFGIVATAGAGGVWLFYVQHQFEGVYWERRADWDYCAAALEGSSFYKLPRILQWFSGNIGFHHIHHLSPRIPNYNLEKCHQAEPLFQRVKPVTFFSSFKALTFRLWDERGRKLVGFRALKNRLSQ